MTPSTLIFLHVPKTAGSTLNGVLDRRFRARETFIYHPRSPTRSLEALARLSDGDKRSIKLLRGHLFFGIHESLPQPATYITILRDPIDRVVSFYHYVLRTPAHYLNERIRSEPDGIRALLKGGDAGELNNMQTRFISGVDKPAEDWTDPATSRPILSMAKDNLQRSFSLAGLSERFDETLALLQTDLEWKRVFYSRRNVTRDRPPVGGLEPSDLEFIGERNRLDIELYDFARLRFEQRIAEQGKDYRRNLQSIRKWSGPLARFAQPLTAAIERVARAVERE